MRYASVRMGRYPIEALQFSEGEGHLFDVFKE
jgi:hypothetical protein